MKSILLLGTLFTLWFLQTDGLYKVKLGKAPDCNGFNFCGISANGSDATDAKQENEVLAQQPNVPDMGVFDNPIVVPPLPCVGCPGSTVFTIKNNSKCSTYLKFVLGFTAQQGAIETIPFTLPDYYSSNGPVINITNSQISTELTSSVINTTQPYNLIEGGFDIYFHDPDNGINTVMGNLKPGQSITVHYPVNSSNTELCKCYKLSWNEATNTITIDDCN